ncbi:MAG TPA: regulatory protein RecX [Spirochaetota bacterium]|nr:regulatory protein RecX [Spirochaetota bacterium]HOM37638.1 regulatory protein RecX [Spirochaetota bacterium]HPQ49391.1 regulatory protein RecX [Spirochaetota bacterium]
MNKRIIVIIDNKKVSVKPDEIDKFSSFEEAYKKAISDAYKHVNRLIKIRDRSEYEIRNRLKDKGFCDAEIDYVIGDLLKNRLLNDRRFTKNLIESYTKKGYGPFTLRKKLIEKGIDSNTIDEYLKEIDIDQTFERARDLIIHKIKAYKEKANSLFEIYEKIRRYLFSRGFDGGTIERVIDYFKENNYFK